jgi:hypothetical protein
MGDGRIFLKSRCDASFNKDLSIEPNFNRILLAGQYLKAMQTRIYREKYTFCVLKSLEHLKNLKTVRVPYLGLELTMHVLKSQIHLVRKSFYNIINKSGMYVGFDKHDKHCTKYVPQTEYENDLPTKQKTIRCCLRIEIPAP